MKIAIKLPDVYVDFLLEKDELEARALANLLQMKLDQPYFREKLQEFVQVVQKIVFEELKTKK